MADQLVRQSREIQRS